MTLTCLLLQLVALTFYTSNLVSALTVGPPLPPYKDLQAVHTEPSLKLVFLKGGTQLDYIKVCSSICFFAIVIVVSAVIMIINIFIIIAIFIFTSWLLPLLT